MLVVWRLRCLPILLLVYCILANAQGTNTAGSSRGQDRRNPSNRHRRMTTSDPHESINSPQLSTATPVAMQRFPVPWDSMLDADVRARQGNSVRVTRKPTEGGRTKTRKHGTYTDHVAVAMETVLPWVTDQVISSEVVKAPSGADGSKRPKPGEGKPFAVTRTTAETTEQRQPATDAIVSQRIHRVKTREAATSPAATTSTPTTTRITPSTTTRLPLRRHSTTSVFGIKSTSTTTYSNRNTSKSSSAKDEGCSSSCEMHRCETVEAEMCHGRVVKDRCNCCPVCLVEQRTDEWREDATTKKTSHQPSNACDGMLCPKHKVCILNIQGIPMCRCPNIYSCKGIDRSPLCAENGETYKNKCFLKVDECTVGHRIRIDHRGSCRSQPTTVQLETPFPTLKTSIFNPDQRTIKAPHRKSGKNDPWRNRQQQYAIFQVAHGSRK